MVKSITARYETAEAARNAHDDLVATGYPNEKLFLDPDKAETKVISAPETEREAREILGRHDPAEITDNEI